MCIYELVKYQILDTLKHFGTFESPIQVKEVEVNSDTPEHCSVC